MDRDVFIDLDGTFPGDTAVEFLGGTTAAVTDLVVLNVEKAVIAEGQSEVDIDRMVHITDPGDQA